MYWDCSFWSRISAGLVLVGLTFALPANAAVLFGPERFTRAAGAPDTTSRTFAANNADATYRLVVENGAAGKDRVSSVTMSLNGVEVIRPSDLNQRVERVEKEVRLLENNTLAVRLSSNPGGFLTVNLFCVSDCRDLFDLSIDSPSDGSTVNRVRVLVQGRLINASGETGVVLTVAGTDGGTAELAQIQGDRFAGLVSLHTGENTIVATATDASGNQVRKEITIHADSVQEKVSLSALPASGIPEASGIFATALQAETNLSAPVALYAWDFEGDGIVEQSGANLSTVTAQYSQPGLYFPRLTVTDAQGASSSATTVVNVLRREEIDALLQGKWHEMQGSLRVGNVEKAVALFTDATQEKYRGLFTFLADSLPQMADEMDNIQLIYLHDRRAKYRIRRMEDGQEITYYIYFHQLSDGLWKIYQF